MPGFRLKAITHWLIAANTVLYLISSVLSASLFDQSIEVLVALGANYGPLTSQGEPWRLITSVFLHAGAIHFLFNNAVLFQIGTLLEQLIPRWLLAVVYLVCGIGASATSLFINYGVVSIGASGAIFGLFGFFGAVLTTDLLHPQARKAFVKNIGFFILINILIGMVGPIDNAAHMGGLVTGFILGLLSLGTVRRRLSKPRTPHHTEPTDP